MLINVYFCCAALDDCGILTKADLNYWKLCRPRASQRKLEFLRCYLCGRLVSLTQRNNRPFGIVFGKHLFITQDRSVRRTSYVSIWSHCLVVNGEARGFLMFFLLLLRTSFVSSEKLKKWISDPQHGTRAQQSNDFNNKDIKLLDCRGEQQQKKIFEAVLWIN